MGARCGAVILLSMAWCAGQGQSQPELREILNRLERLEQQNRELVTEIRSLREQLAAGGPARGGGDGAVDVKAAQPTLDERVSVAERRSEEQEQSKLGSDHKQPVTLTGMALFNAFLNGRSSGAQYPTTAALTAGASTAGGSFRQSVVGLKFSGPDIPWGGKVDGSAYVDLFAGTGASLNQLARLRVATVNANWKNTTVTVGQDKPIIAPREPESLAQVGVSPLTGAGNLWLWQPQVRVEQRFHFGESAGLRAQVGVYQTSENSAVTAEYRDTLQPARPGFEGRFEFWKEAGTRRFELAPGYHWSDTHVLGRAVPSRIVSADWLFRPVAQVDLSGAFFAGKNVAGLGSLRQGVTIFSNRIIRPIGAYGGWAQIAYRPTQRVTLHLYGGQENDRAADLERGNIARNLVYAGNVMYRLGANVIASFEASQTRTTYMGAGMRLNPHYDLALAYLF